MVRVSVGIAAAIAVSTGCGADRVAQEPVRAPVERASVAPEQPAVVRVPENPLDRGIRRDLNLAIGQDTELKQREISFNVVNGDVTVMGTVRSEDERTKINDIVMNIGGVKSIANALRVAGAE
jgi:BON domain-containing protein